jgi:predicted adenylyl cyclase CyaB
LLAALGFKPVATVRKRRQKFQITHAGHDVEGSLDDVDAVGKFVELELVANDQALDEARRVIAELARELKLGPSDRRSYLELLLATE